MVSKKILEVGFQNLNSVLSPRRSEVFNRRNILNIARIGNFAPTLKLGLNGGSETTSNKNQDFLF